MDCFQDAHRAGGQQERPAPGPAGVQGGWPEAGGHHEGGFPGDLCQEERGNRLCVLWKSSLRESNLCFQGVSEVFHKVLAQMEKESGKQPDGGKTCVIS